MRRYWEGKAAADRVAELEALAEQGPPTEEQVAELAELRPKAQKWQKKQEGYAERRRAIKAAADRVAELEELAEQGPLTVEQAAELAELRPKVAQRKQKQNETVAKYRRARMGAAVRVAELEALAERVPLSEEQVAELAELRPKVAQQKQKQNDQYRTRRAAADRVAELEALAERVPLSEEQVAELAELRPKVAQQKQKQNDQYRTGKAAADRVAELEALAERVPLSEEQVAELAELRPKTQQWQKKKERSADRARARIDAADRVAVLEALADRGPLSEEQVAELAELRPKVAQQKQKKKEYEAKYRQGLKAAADRVAVLEALAERGPLTEEQTAELAALRSKAAGQGRKKKDRDVTETGVGGVLVVGRVAGPEGESGETGADQVDLDVWSADVDPGGSLDLAMADVDGAQVPQGAADAGAMLGEGAYEEFVANELPAFLGQDAGDHAAGAGGAGAVAGGDDFAGFLPDYTDWEGSVGLFGVDGPDGLFFGEPFPEDAVWPDAGDAVESGVWEVADPVAGGESVGAWDRFLRGVNQANYGSGDERYQVNCLEAVVALHNSVKFGRQFVAGPAGGDRGPGRLEVAFGATARRVAGVVGAEQYVRSMPGGVAVPVIYQRTDGSAHVIAAVHAGDGDGVDLLDAQKGRKPRPLMSRLRPGCG